MRASVTSGLRIAISEGPGSGRFLAVSLLDALDAGRDLRQLRVSPPARAAGSWSVDFVFELDPAHREVIRAGLDAADRVVFTELLRAPPPDGDGQVSDRRYAGRAALAAALRSGSTIEFVRVESGDDSGAPRAVRLQLRRGEPFRLELFE